MCASRVGAPLAVSNREAHREAAEARCVNTNVENATLDDAAVATIVGSWTARNKEKAIELDAISPKRSKKRPKKGIAKYRI